MIDTLQLVRGANPVPAPTPLPPPARARILARVEAGAGAPPRLRRPPRLRVLALSGALVLAVAAGAAALSGSRSRPPSGWLRSAPAYRAVAPTAYVVSVLPNLQGGGAGWCVSDAVYAGRAMGLGAGGARGCGYAPQPDRPIVAVGGSSSGGRNGDEYAETDTDVFLTTAAAAAVRLSPTLSILTRRDPQLPAGYRVAIRVTQTLSHRPIRTGAPGPTEAVALDRDGQPIGLPGDVYHEPRLPATFWPAHRSRTPPVGACEIVLLGGLRGSSGFVVPRVHALPGLAGRPYVSCADTLLAASPAHSATVAILLDARDPGRRPVALPGAHAVAGRTQTVDERPLPSPHRGAATTLLDPGLTARRVGDAWLVVESSGTLGSRLRILARVRACIHLAGPPCPSPGA